MMTGSSSSRREFLQIAAAGAASLFVPGAVGAATKEGIPPIELTKRLKVPLLGMGTGVKGGMRSNALWRSGEKNFRETVRRAYDEGVRLFDCADMYGSVPHVAKALKDKPRESWVLVTKIWCHPKGGIPADEPRDNAAAVVERTLREAHSEFVDLVQLHCQTKSGWTDTYRKHMEQLAECKERGLLKAHGCSCHSLVALEEAANDPWVDVIHSRINPWGVKMDGPADKVVPILKKAHAAGKGVIGMKLVGEGAFRDEPEKIDKSLEFVLGLECVDALIVGFEKPAEIVDYKARLMKALAVKA